ncbi:MAG: SDR family oxidoreductase [Bifidobacteriaceae bacterium]|nr:SDR family oxidoreductase [Bifidobacteriaceae bacterium]
MSRHVFITGANRGIGRAIARAFFDLGDNISTVDRQGSGPQIESPGIEGDRIAALKGDITDTDQVGQAFDQAESRFGKVEVLVANAGIVRDQLLIRMSDQDFAAVMDANLAGAFRCVRRAALSMVPRRRGAIVLIGSVVAAIGGAGQANYATSKAGLVGLARSVAREVGGRGITANVIAPGFIETDMTAALPPKTQEAYRAQIPARRFGTVDDVAQAATFLASAPYINGAVIPVDGGLGMGH